MQPTRQQFVDMLKAHLARSAPPKADGTPGEMPPAEVRRQIYQRVRAVLDRSFAAAPPSVEDIGRRAAFEEALDAAIEEIEASIPPAGRTEGILSPLHRWSEVFEARYASLVALFSGLVDFLKPIFELTGPVLLASGIGTLALTGAAVLVPAKRAPFRVAAVYVGLLFLCTGTWYALQNAIPGASANGVIAETVPGLDRLQAAVGTALGRIETETRRVGDLIESNTRREEEERKKRIEAEARQKEAAKARIVEAGFGLDGKGLVDAVRAGFRYLGDFAALGVVPDEASIVAALPVLKDEGEVARTVAFLRERRDDHGFLRRILERIESDRSRIRDLFEGADAQKALCDPATWAQPLATGLMAPACGLSAQPFARRFAAYARAVHDVALEPASLSIRAARTLPAKKLLAGAKIKSLPADCSYYEVDLQFATLMDRPMPSDEHQGLSTVMYYDGPSALHTPIELVVVDPDYTRYNFEKRCTIEMVQSARGGMCRARMLLLSGCEAEAIRIVRVLDPPAAQGSASGPADVQVLPRPIQPASGGPGDVVLTPAEVRSQIVKGTLLAHGPDAVLRFRPDGTFEASRSGTRFTGRHVVGPDGRLCWTNSFGLAGCFEYYRKANRLMVRRADTINSNDIGPVTPALSMR